jgi:hypothetical protein
MIFHLGDSMLTVTFHFDSVEAAAAFLATQGVQSPQVEFVIPEPTKIVGTEPQPDVQPEKKARKPRADAGKPRGPYNKAAEAPAETAAAEQTVKASPASPAPTTAAAAPAPAAELTIDDLKAAMTVLAKKKNIEANMAVLRKFGVGQVSKLPKEHYAAFLAAVNAAAGVA